MTGFHRSMINKTPEVGSPAWCHLYECPHAHPKERLLFSSSREEGLGTRKRLGSWERKEKGRGPCALEKERTYSEGRVLCKCEYSGVLLEHV